MKIGIHARTSYAYAQAHATCLSRRATGATGGFLHAYGWFVSYRTGGFA